MLNDDKRQRITELVCGIGKGNVSDLKELIELIQHDLQKLAMSYLFDVYLAEEVVSDTFRKIIEKSNTLTSTSNIFGWIKTILINKCLNIIKKRKPEVSYEELIEKNYQFFDSSSEELLERIHITECLKKMKEPERITLLLHVDGYTYKEISIITNMSMKKVRNILIKAKTHFEKLYNDGQKWRRQLLCI